MDCLNAYLLTTLFIDATGSVASRNLGVTFDLFKAEAHRARMGWRMILKGLSCPAIGARAPSSRHSS